MAPSATLQAPVVPAQASTQPVPAAAPTPSSKSSRYRSLDLWRGAACMLLVFYHTSFYVEPSLKVRDTSTWSVHGAALKAANLSWIGVPIFFVVSGYCIAASVDSMRRKGYSLKTYFGRRVHRIYPPLWIACLWAVAVTLTIRWLWPSLYQECVQLPRWEDWSIWNWLGNITATESWQYHASGTKVSYLMKNTWTLCYEEQFYLAIGAVLALSAHHLMSATLFLCIGTLACRHIARAQGADLDGFFFAGHWLLFAAGIFLFHQLTHASRATWWATCAMFTAGMVYAFVDRRSFAIGEDDRHFDEYLFVSCGFALLLLALRRWDNLLTECRLLHPFRWCGQRSYSIYLTHYPVVVALSCFLTLAGFTTTLHWLLVTLPVCLAVSLVLGWVFHILVERHFLNAPMS